MWLITHFFPFQAGVIEMPWVVADFTATPGTNEVSVVKGQQVEVLDATATTSAWCLVRLAPISGADGGGTQEGLVPVSVLKPPPSKQGRRQQLEAAAEHTVVENNGKYLPNHKQII